VRLLVCGWRKLEDEESVRRGFEQALACYRSAAITVLHGGASGTDLLADRIARSFGYPVIIYEADWRRFGKYGGPERNNRMIAEGMPDLVLAFPHILPKMSRGTWDCVHKACRAGVPCVIFPVGSSEDRRPEAEPDAA